MRRKDREVTELSEIRKVIDTCKVCRMGLIDDEGVYIVPVNYGYELEDGNLILYFHGAKEGKKLELLHKNPKIGIEMDCGHNLVEGKMPCQYSYNYASMIGKGTARITEDPEEKIKALELIMKQQTGKDFDAFRKNPKLANAVTIIRVDVSEYTCKKYM